ncbi:putative SspB-like ClpXP adaptor protein [Erwinia phage vB_EamM_RAY]|uniref:SspB-like ClpXP adaptor protein n=7 Tax=Agricanvirus TaxID=1984776 RepID=A0A173GDX7_9CAUD|nr:stringent starvation protein Sspb-like [Erwinia phage Ea35-70]YP_009605183.1 stringent starvation protein Sspb-like [Erwinia phage vB_EamM_Deimos-Minion]YP_009605506.1 stringent starvation protein Sspb-like [Erwinia phage vB_EamM_RAY]YP_009605824.1 stringent starvation protein Sspb-like [Erwinia phage vB_EamM_Simmy50]YP_009606145.1 stringent starvation protein Sspb-like [Erwinia phage vB_EamM_Special G]YP_009621780.1 stringent starvation protein Sspb-like [Erwinia phage vB_EamM_Desertfox]A
MSEQKPLIPFLHFQIDAFRNYLVANDLTPYAVFTLPKGLDPVLDRYADPASGQLILNLSPNSCGHYEITDDGYMVLHQRFSGKAHEAFLPVQHLLAMYARERQDQAMVFADIEHTCDDDVKFVEDETVPEVDDTNVTALPFKKPTLTVVK